jgi:hypothetical protein
MVGGGTGSAAAASAAPGTMVGVLLLFAVLLFWCQQPSTSADAGIIAAPATTDRATAFNGDRPWVLMEGMIADGRVGHNRRP